MFCRVLSGLLVFFLAVEVVMASPQPIVLNPTQTHQGTVIFLHGLGDSGAGWVNGMRKVQATNPHVKFILPSAPSRKMTYSGRVVPGWFDVTEPGNTNDRKGLDETRAKINEIIENEIQLGIPSERIIVGGFSQGCVTSIFTVFQSEKRLGGCIALSGYLVFPTIFQTLINPANSQTPVLMYHGELDHMLPFSLGKKSAELLQSFGIQVRFVPVPNMFHSVNEEEMAEVAKFVQQVIPLTSPSQEAPELQGDMICNGESCAF